jgi:L-threonylcarbamoyladenylate synthase
VTARLVAAIAALDAGEIVCFPTESSYGLGVRVDRPAALERLARVKGRAADSAFGLVAADEAQARALWTAWPARAAELATQHWPGPLTLVIPGRPGLPVEIVGPGGGVGVRVPTHEIARGLPLGAGVAVTATSANPSGARPALSVEEARGYFGDAVAVYLDGGIAKDVPPSTVVWVGIDGGVRVLRPGAIVIQENPA